MSILDKLNSDFDINNLTADQLTKALTEHQNTLIKIVLVIGSLIGVVAIFNDYHTNDKKLHLKISQVQDKIIAIKAHEAASQELKDFKSSVREKLNEVELITLFSKYAKSSHVTLASISPGQSLDKDLYSLIAISINAESDDYKSMMLFLRKIERSKFPLRIDSWSGHEEESGKIAFTIDINAVLIH